MVRSFVRCFQHLFVLAMSLRYAAAAKYIEKANLPTIEYESIMQNSPVVSIGNRCRKMDPEITPTHGKQVFISSDTTHTIYFKSPQQWTTGKYVCIWNVTMVAERNEGTGELAVLKGIDISFKRVNLQRKQWSLKCRDNITLTSFSTEEIYLPNNFCQQSIRREFQMSSNTVQLRLDIRIPAKTPPKKKSAKRTSFAVKFSASKELQIRKRYKVEDILSLQPNLTPIQSALFSWSEAKEFCKNYSQPGWNLCQMSQACPWKGLRFLPRYSWDHTQYYPVEGEYNFWVREENFFCQTTSELGPPPWGVDKSSCPDDDCGTKEYIYCCPPNPVYPEPSYEAFLLPVYITTALSGNNFLYRFSEREEVEKDYDTDEPGWDEHWKKVGRIAGDINTFQLQSGYSPDFPTPVYFCSKYQNLDRKSLYKRKDPRLFRFRASLSPCEQPWKLEFYRYSSTEPQKGMTPLYFGYGEELGSRVSLDRQCCGYDKESFAIYGKFDKSMRAEVPNSKCPNAKSVYKGPSGTITSPLYPESMPQYLRCSWNISVKKNHGILIQFNSFLMRKKWGLDNCRDSYLEIQDKVANLTLGRLCSLEDLPRDFLTSSNAIAITVVTENLFEHGQFSFNFTEVGQLAPSPTIYELDKNPSWDEAKSFCDSKGTRLCWKQELCPLHTTSLGQQRHLAGWIAIADRPNEWLKIHDGFKPCVLYTDHDGPPLWNTTEKSDECEGDFSWDGYPCSTERNKVLCCDYPDTPDMLLSNLSYFLPNIREPTQEIRVNVAYFEDFRQTYYLFHKGEKWSAPQFKIYDYDKHRDMYHDFGPAPLLTANPWQPPGRKENADSRVIDYFVLSSSFVKGVFDQAVYFCSQKIGLLRNNYIPDAKKYMISLKPCRHHWKFEFFLYAGRTKSERTPVALRIGKADSLDERICCTEIHESVTIYVISAETESSYEGMFVKEENEESVDNGTDYGYYWYHY